VKNGEVINLNDLESKIPDKTPGISNLTYSLIGLFIIIVLGIISFLVIKNKHRKSEKISAEDMTIVD
jgi:hypothetical protein